MAEEKLLEYEGRTLMKSGNTVYYGNRETGVWLQMIILETKNVNDLDLATNVFLQIVDYKDGKTNILKQAQKNSFYDALEIGTIWLERAEKGTL